MSDFKIFELTEQLKARVRAIRNDNAHKVVEAGFGGNKTVNLDAVALTQDLSDVINRARQLRSRSSIDCQDDSGMVSAKSQG